MPSPSYKVRSGPISPWIDPMLTIEPPPRAAIQSPNARVTENSPVALICMLCVKCAASSSHPATGLTMELLIRISIREAPP